MMQETFVPHISPAEKWTAHFCSRIEELLRGELNKNFTEYELFKMEVNL